MKKYNVNFFQTIQVEAKNKKHAEEFARNLMEDNFKVSDMETEVEEIKFEEFCRKCGKSLTEIEFENYGDMCESCWKERNT